MFQKHCIKSTCFVLFCVNWHYADIFSSHLSILTQLKMHIPMATHIHWECTCTHKQEDEAGILESAVLSAKHCRQPFVLSYKIHSINIQTQILQYHNGYSELIFANGFLTLITVSVIIWRPRRLNYRKYPCMCGQGLCLSLIIFKAALCCFEEDILIGWERFLIDNFFISFF